VQPCQLRKWKNNKEDVLDKASSIKYHTFRQSFMSKETIHQGRKPQTSTEELDRIKTMYDELWQRDRVVTSTILVHNLRQNDVLLKELPSLSLRRCIHHHLVKLGVAKRRVIRVAHNIWYDQTVKQQYIQYTNEKIKIGHYHPQDIVSIDETNFDFDQTSGETLADRGEKMIGCAMTGSAHRCTVLTMYLLSVQCQERPPPYIIFKGKDTRERRVWKVFFTVDKRAGNGYPEEALYAIQDNAWMYQKRFLDWNTRVWTPFTQRPRASVYGSYMIMDEFKVHLMGSCLNAIQNNGTILDAPTLWKMASLTHLKLVIVKSLIIVC
jgi:hypothetical protein